MTFDFHSTFKWQQVQAELERQQAAEEEREKAVQKQQQDIAALQQEVDIIHSLFLQPSLGFS